MVRQSTSSLNDADVIIVGAGVIGLAIAAELASDRSVVVLEHYGKFGQETSSRNSEVIHSGIYYPPQSRKTRWCIEGRDLLYKYCRKKHIAHRQCGKYLVATHPEELSYLEKRAAHCRDVGVPFERISAEQLREKEPRVRALGALYFPLSGILDSHELMASLEREAASQHGILAYHHRATGFEKKNSGWLVEGTGPEGNFSLSCEVLVNAAGLAAAEIANRIIQDEKYTHQFCRGRYFFLSSRFQNAFQSLIYPVPQKDGLGIHVTIDLSGRARLGPDTEWCESGSYDERLSYYDCQWESLIDSFAQAARRYCPQIKEEDLSPGFVGIRPKLFAADNAVNDFLLESGPGVIHCLGIESPGLTASLAIAREVHRQITLGF